LIFLQKLVKISQNTRKWCGEVADISATSLIPVNAAPMPALPQPAATPRLSINAALDGVFMCSKPTVGGIMVKQELERLWNNNSIVNKVKDLIEREWCGFETHAV
jgi:hypothetical protein